MIQKRTLPTATCEWCPREDAAELQAFIDVHWRKGHVLARDRALLQWQFPGEQAGYLNVLVARDEQGIAGILGVIPFPFCHEGNMERGAWLSMWVVRKELQSSGIGLHLLQHVLKSNYACVGTLGGNGTTMRILGALRFHCKESLPRWILPGSPSALESLAKAAPPDVGAAMLEFAKQCKNIPSPRAESASKLQVNPWNEQNATGWNEAWNSRFAPRNIGVWRDADYVHHRYASHPSFQYQIRVVRENQQVRGLLVYRVIDIRDRSEKVVRVLEWMVEPGFAGLLLGELTDAVGAPNVAFADFYCTDPAVGQELSAVGFQLEGKSAQAFPSRFQPLDFRKAGLTGAWWCSPAVASDSRAFFDHSLTYFTSADCDQDRPN
ncbi:MAG: GNAT family N-acetyltransferase [Planctomycetota bacterium]